MKKTIETRADRNVPATIAGAGGGTLLVLLSKNIPDTYWIKSWLILMAPTLSVILTIFWTFITKRVEQYLREREVQNLKRKMHLILLSSRDNPNIPEEERKKLEVTFARLEVANFESLANRIESIIVQQKK